MKKLYNEFFYVPKYGKVKEKVMLMRTALTVAIMVVCLFAMSFTAYAYFSNNVTSGSNIIKAANFEAQITVSSGTDVVSLTSEGKYQVAALEKGKTYSVTLAAPTSDGSADTGFCVITDRYQSKIYHTQQLGVDEAVEGGKTPFITFTLTVSEDVDVFFLSHWGTSSSYDPYKTNSSSEELYVCGGDVVDIVVVNSTSGVSNTKGENDDESSETTSKETTTGETTESTTTPTEVVYTVQSGDTLSSIAKQFNTTVTKLAAYNGISNPNAIVTGQKISIPPADYEVPIETTPEITTTPETTTPPETTPSETTGTTETQSTSETSTSTEPTDSEETTETTSEQETQPAEETTGAPDTEETGGSI